MDGLSVYAAIQMQNASGIASIGDHWGDLCATAELATSFAQMLPTLRRPYQARKRDGGKAASFGEMGFEFRWNSTGVLDCCQILTCCQRHPWLSGFDRLDQCAREHNLCDRCYLSRGIETVQRTMIGTHDETWRAGIVTATEEFTCCMQVEGGVIRSLDLGDTGVSPDPEIQSVS